MKAATATYSFSDILRMLATQDPEEKLRIAFRLRSFVVKIRKAGETYAKTNQRHRAGRVA
jgi:hypothetical protein